MEMVFILITFPYQTKMLFEQRVHQDMSTKDPVFISINNKVMYKDVPDQVHEVVLVGCNI